MAGEVTIDPATPRPRHAWRDRWLALAVFLTLAAIYVATLLPGLGGTEDTPKFQYVGAALGTPHDPGYPLYMIACWVFSKLPVGTLAYRINLLSACWGALAGALVFLTLRRLAVPRGIAGCTALALGLGRFFWQHSTFAEAYTQASALTAAAFLALLLWDKDGRDRWLYAAVAVVSLAFGTHLIVVGMIPAFAWFVLTRYRWCVPLRVLAVIAVIVTLGIAQYGYVWIRTAQHARYLEARANSFGELFDTIRGRQFQGQTFKEPPLVIARTRVPEVAGAARTELGSLAVIAGVAGILALWSARRRAAVLLAGSFLGCAALLAMLGRVATEGILLPAMMPCWMLAGAGFAFAWAHVGAIANRTARTVALGAAAIAIAAVPAQQAWQNYEYDNSRGDTYYTDYFAALAVSLRGPAAFVREDYWIGHMLEYQWFAARMPGVVPQFERDPDAIAQRLRAGVSVYAFRQAFDALDGLIRVRPIALTGRPINDRLLRLRHGKIVVMAGFAPVWPEMSSLSLAAGDRVTGRAVAISVTGVGPAVLSGRGFEGVVEVRAGERLGKTGHLAPVSIRVEVRGTRASIAVDGLPVVHTDTGLVVAEIGADLEAHYVLRPETAFKAPIDMGALPLYRVLEVMPADSCTALASGAWAGLANIGREGRLVAHLNGRDAFTAAWTVYVAGDRPLPARVWAWTGPGDPATSADVFEPSRDPARLRMALAADGVDAAAELLAAHDVTRLTVTSSADYEPAVFRINLGALASYAWARVVLDQPTARRASLCAGTALPLEPDPGTGEASLYLGPGGDWFFGEGWHNATPAPIGYSRRTDGSGATLLLPIARPSAITLRLSVEALDGASVVAPFLNGRRLSEQPLAGGWNELAWPVDAAGWRAGVNMLSLEVSAAGTAGAAPSLRVRRVALDWSEAPSIRD